MSEWEIPVRDADADLDALDEFLISDRSPPDSMMLSDLDGFLTGIAVGPELVMPSEWLPVVWGGAQPDFAHEREAESVIGAIMSLYNAILREIEDGALEPIFWTAKDGTVIAADWAEGFMQAVGLRLKAWERLLTSKRDGLLLFPILALCGGEDGESLLGIDPEDEDLVMAEATETIPATVIAIADYWRRRRPRQNGTSATPTTAKPGRNAPCPCGSGKKFKKCCGQGV